MNCVEARGALAVVDLRDLRDLATGDDGLAAHLRECADCRALADTIIAQTSLLAVRVQRRARRRRTRVFMLAAGIPVAAAAVFTVAFRDGRGVPRAARAEPAALPVARHVSVTVARGQSAAVLATADTTVTVVWITGAGQ